MKQAIEPFPRCPSFDGYHCQTSSLAKIFYFHQNPLAEEILLGPGAGMGFEYLHQKEGYPLIGGRGNITNFFKDISTRTGVNIEIKSTENTQTAEQILCDMMNMQKPLMLYGDMGFLPWFVYPESYHFGGHTFVLCGYDENNTFLASDIEQITSGLKRGFYAPVTKEQLVMARNSPYQPYPPGNAWFVFDFTHYNSPGKEEIYSAINQTVDQMMNPPVNNKGVNGIRYTAEEIVKWPGIYNNKEIRMCLFNMYIFFEAGGTGGGCFRYMFARFLKQAATIIPDEKLSAASTLFEKTGRLFTELADQIVNLDKNRKYDTILKDIPDALFKIADEEEKAYRFLSNIMK